MKSTERSSVTVWMWFDWFCSSTFSREAPGEVHAQPGGRVDVLERRTQVIDRFDRVLAGRRRETEGHHRGDRLAVGGEALVGHARHPRDRPHGALDAVDRGEIGRGERLRGGRDERGVPGGPRPEWRRERGGPHARCGRGEERGVGALLDAGQGRQGDAQDDRHQHPARDDRPSEPYAEPSEGGEQGGPPVSGGESVRRSAWRRQRPSGRSDERSARGRRVRRRSYGSPSFSSGHHPVFGRVF